MAIFKSKFYPFHTSQKNRVSYVAVKVAVTKNLVAVKGPQVAVVSGGSGSEGLPGSGNPGSDPTQFTLQLASQPSLQYITPR